MNGMPPAGEAERKKKLAAQALGVLSDCRAQKGIVAADLREAYFFTRPRLADVVESTSAPSAAATNRDQDELATGLGQECSEDFATEVIAAFFPQNVNWAQSAPSIDLDEGQFAQVQDDIEEYDQAVFTEIRASNFDAELSTALDPEASVGTLAFWIAKDQAHEPVRVDHVPLRELEINVGPYGQIDERCRVRWVAAGKLRAVIGYDDITLPADLEEKIRKGSKAKVEVAWIFWRDWEEPTDEVWKFVLLVDRKVVADKELRGEGCCPLVVARFSPDKLHSFGNGPAIRSLPELRIHDAMNAATQDRIDIAISPPFAIPDGMDLEGGLEAGKAYPVRPGSSRDIKALYFEGNMDAGLVVIQDIEKKIRRKFFADYPEQRGDTPPSATQWVDEMVRAQRRIGTPGLSFWREGPAQIFRRFAFILEAYGKLKRVEVAGRKLPLAPNNPATQAQEQQEVQVALRLLQIALGMFPETAKVAIDERATLDNIKQKLRDKLVTLRSVPEAQKLLAGVLQTAQQTGALPAPGGGGANGGA